MTDTVGDAELPELGIPLTSQTPVAYIVSALRRLGYTDLAQMKHLAAEYRDACRYRGPRPPMTLEQRGSSADADEVTASVVREPSAKDVREWATRNKIDVPARGRLRPELYDQYKAEISAMVPFEGGAPIPADPPREA